MPRMDGTGPTGQGSGTGRGMGTCRTSGTGSNRGASNRSAGWLGIAVGLLSALGLGAYGVNRGTRGSRGQGRRRNI